MRRTFFLCSLLLTTSIGSADVAKDLCSLDGLTKLIPDLKNSQGKFEIPNPKKNLDKFITVHQTLTNIIEMALTQANVKGNPYTLSEHPQATLRFPAHWRSAEIGLMTNGNTVGFPDNNQLASYGGISFLDGLTSQDKTNPVFYEIRKKDGSIPALITAQPTVLACVNRIVLAGANTAGTWIPPSYALGTTDGKAYLVVDQCIDLGLAVKENGANRLVPNAELFKAIHWVDTIELAHMRTKDKAHRH